MIFRIIFSFALFCEGALQLERTCIDEEIYNQCATICDFNFIDCRQNCGDSECSNKCVDEYLVCESSCPCGSDCFAGCAECPDHPLCPDECEDAQLNNEEYKTCLNEAVNELDICLKTCPPEIDCHNSCYASYSEKLFLCPCIEVETTTTSEVSTVTTTTTELMPIEPSDVFILVITQNLHESYLESGDGSSQIPVTINAPHDEYSKYAAHALLNGQLHIFGGRRDNQRIARLDDCSLNELPTRLKEERKKGAAALTIENGRKVLICFGYDEDYEINKSCETFDGSSTVSTFSSEWSHEYGGLGFYKGQPSTVGCNYDEHQKAETLSATGWTALQEHPLRTNAHSLVGLENQSMILLGGLISEIQNNGIWQLKDGQWRQIGELLQHAYDGAAIYIGRSIYFFASDYCSFFPIQRLDFNENEDFQKVELIGIHPQDNYGSALLQTNPDYCV